MHCGCHNQNMDLACWVQILNVRVFEFLFMPVHFVKAWIYLFSLSLSLSALPPAISKIIKQMNLFNIGRENGLE